MTRLSADDLVPLRELRTALQAEFEVGREKSDTTPQPDFATLLRDLSWRMTIKEGRLALFAEGSGWRTVASTLLADIFVAQQPELWPRLKACRNSPCSVIFYDGSKNQSRVWHNTSDCGNLINLRASRARRREENS